MRTETPIALLALPLVVLACDSGTSVDAVTPSRIRLLSVDADSVAVGSTLPLSVEVTDENGTPIGGVSVAWQVEQGGGAVDPAKSTTGSDGVADTQWALGTRAGEQGVKVSVGELEPLTFSLTATPGSVTAVTVTPGTVDLHAIGDTAHLSATAEDQYGNAHEHAVFTWSSTDPAVATVNDAGTATGERAGSATITATYEGVSGAATVKVTAAKPVALVRVSGDAQFGLKGSTLADPLVVRVADAKGDPLIGIEVTWQVTAGMVSPATSVTNSGGVARTEWTLGNAAGQQVATAAADGLTPVSFTAIAMTEAGGIISRNTRWNAPDSPYKLTRDVQIAYGATLTIDPGVAVYGDGYRIGVWGVLNAVGNENARVIFNDTHITPRGSIREPEPFLIRIQFAEVNSGSIYAPTGNSGYGSLTLTNSVLTNLSEYMYIWYPNADCFIEQNIFTNSGGISTGTDESTTVYVRNNVFQGQTTPYAVENWASYDTSMTIVKYNSFLSTDRVAVRLPDGYGDAKLDAKQNYWNTTNKRMIESMIYDNRDDLNAAGRIDYMPFLSEPHPDTPVK